MCNSLGVQIEQNICTTFDLQRMTRLSYSIKFPLALLGKRTKTTEDKARDGTEVTSSCELYVHLYIRVSAPGDDIKLAAFRW